MANTQNLDLVKPLGTDYALVSVLNSNSDKIDAYAGAVNASLDGLRDGLGVLADGNTHAAITSGQFVYVKNHQTLPQGLYQATTNIAANGTLSTSNLAADPKGGLNTLSEHIANLGLKTLKTVYDTAAAGIITLDDSIYNYSLIVIAIRATASGYGHCGVAIPDKWCPGSVAMPDGSKGFYFSMDGTTFTISSAIGSDYPYLYGIYGIAK